MAARPAQGRWRIAAPAWGAITTIQRDLGVGDIDLAVNGGGSAMALSLQMVNTNGSSRFLLRPGLPPGAPYAPALSRHCQGPKRLLELIAYLPLPFQ